MKNMKTAFNLIGCGAVLLLTGCASVVCGPKQDIAIDSRPRGAQVQVFGASCEEIFSGTTPCTATLDRRPGDSKTGCYVVLIKKDGYAPVQVPLAGHVNSAYYLNPLSAGIGFIVDPLTHSMWTLAPETADGDLVSDKAGFFIDDGLFVTMKEQATPAAPVRTVGPVAGFTQLTLGR
jgi:hypothetical protein